MTAAREAEALFLRLADPEAPAGPVPAAGPALDAALDLAERHGLTAVVLRKLGPAAPAAMRQRHAVLAGQSMLLDHLAEKVTGAMAAAGLAFAVVKGPVFARLLYPARGDRTFTDIDLVMPPGDIAAAGRVMEEAGFLAERKAAWDNSERDMEFKWTLASNRSALFELHGNLVHYPALRRRVSLGHAELVGIGGGDPQAIEALLATAVVHAACGHKFHRLQMVVDVLQAARRLPAERAEGFARAAARFGFALEAAVALSLAGRLFGDAGVATLADRMERGPLTALGRRLVTPPVVLAAADPADRGSWARRKAFRLVQCLAPGPRGRFEGG